MNEHRSCVPLRIHRLLVGIFLFLEGFQAEFLHHGICSKCFCDEEERSVVCKGLRFEDISPLPLETRQLTVDGSCSSGRLDQLINSVLPNNTFTVVSITNSCIHGLNLNALRNLDNLIKLDFSGNRLPTIDSSQNVSFDSVKFLTLDSNNLDDSVGVLTSFPKLESLSIRDNAIHDIKAVTENFKNLSRLSHLDLSGNALRRIPIDGLENLPPSLRTLILSDCQIVEIHDDAFRDLSSNLEELDLSGNHLSLNQLKGLLLGFKPGSAMKRLRLARLDIEEIPPDPLWSRMPRLQTLDFTGNRIDEVSYAGFEGLRLHELYVDNNRITKLANVENETAFLDLVVLSLSNNYLATIPVLKLPLLTSIHLGYNKITHIYQSHFSSMPNLESINVTKNYITHIGTLAFTGIKLRSLDVSGNRIGEWDWVKGLQTLVKLNVSGNILGRLSADVFKSTGATLVSLDISSSGLHDVAHNSFATLPALLHLRLGGNGFGGQIESGSLIHLFRDLSNLVSLDLSNIELASIPAEQFDNLTSLRRLYLSDNKISQLCDTSSKRLGESLQVFEVRRNRLKEIDASYLKHLPSLKRVNFAHNPFHCGCAVDSFRQWMNESRAEVVDFHGHGYTCTSPESVKGVPLRAYIAQDCQNTSKTHIILVYTLSFSLLFGVIIFIISFKFKLCKKPRYAYVGGDEFEWNDKKSRRFLNVLVICWRMRRWCSSLNHRKAVYIKHSHSEPLTERSVC